MASDRAQIRRRLSRMDSASRSPRLCWRGPNTCCFCTCLTVRNEDNDDCSRRASTISMLESLQKHEESLTVRNEDNDDCSRRASTISMLESLQKHEESLTVRNEDNDDCSRRASTISMLESLQKHEERGSLSLEEVTAWSQSFHQLLKNPTGRNILMEFLQSEHSDENILFWLACEELKREDHIANIAEIAKSIYLDYISILSPKEVSIDASVRETIDKNMAMPTADMFDEAQVQIYVLMQRDSYPRFLNSPIYKSLLQNITASANALDSQL
ncbi:regulator of G-protein signaling rgs-2-like [Heptranchias perlo]|uniref:regulator of G-protein signaling rgs-2-like n=1 Tax=Heptranchias perlo TaxID=212740 RepID=UPI00355999B9